jgi:hypothetical protein
MITLFALPKAFEGETGLRQHAALCSWRSAVPRAQILLMGEEKGLDEAAREISAERVVEIERNERGTPLVSDAFRQAAAHGKGELLCYINSDILLFDDFTPAVEAVARFRGGPFLLTGRRWNFDQEPGENVPDKNQIRRRGSLYDEFNMDYFVFRRGDFNQLPAFAVGRPGWDSWLVYEARRRGVMMIDATQAITAGHLNHDYSHTIEGRSGGKAAVWSGEEAQANRKRARGRLFDLSDATHDIGSSLRLQKRRDPWHWWRRLSVAHEIYPQGRWFLRPLAYLDEWLRRADHGLRLFLLRRGIDLFPNREKRSVRPAI